MWKELRTISAQEVSAVVTELFKIVINNSDAKKSAPYIRMLFVNGTPSYVFSSTVRLAEINPDKVKLKTISSYITGLIADNAISGGTRWWTYLYATLVLALCLIICLIGGAMFARTSIFILCVSTLGLDGLKCQELDM